MILFFVMSAPYDKIPAMKKSIKPGKIIIPIGVFPEKHELETANVLAGMGHDIEFIRPRFINGGRNPDINMNGLVWEMKTPVGKSKRTIENNYRVAEQQSTHIVFDLRFMKLDENVAISCIKQQFNLRRKRIKRIMIILKNSKILDLSRYK